MRIDTEAMAFFGFSQYESLVYAACLAHPRSTGYKISQESGVPRAKVYETLENLMRRGLVFSSEESGHVLYTALPYRNLVERLKKEAIRNAGILERQLSSIANTRDEPTMLAITGSEPIIKRIEDIISVPSGRIFMAAFPQELLRLKEEILAADKRGTVVYVLSYGHVDLDIKNLHIHPPLASSRVEKEGRLILVAREGGEAIMGHMSDSLQSSGIYVRSEGAVVAIAEYVRHEIVLNALFSLLGDKLESLMAEEPLRSLSEEMWFLR